MKKSLSLLLLILTQPLAAAQPPAGLVTQSKLAHSSVSLVLDPRLDDGRLVIKIAALNRTTQPVTFGPSSISITRLDGSAITLIPLQRLIDDVRLAAGMKPEAPQASTSGAYSAPQMSVDASGRPDVTGYTGSSAIAGDEIIRRSSQNASSTRGHLSPEQAQQQIQALRQAILQDIRIAPGQVAAGQLVSERLKFKRQDDRTIYLRVTIAGDEHGFSLAAPAN